MLNFGSIAKAACFAAALSAVAAVSAYNTDTRPATSEAKKYLSNALELLKLRHINSPTADWEKLEKSAYENIAGADDAEDTYPAIRELLRDLEERHSFLIEPQTADAPPAKKGKASSKVAMPTWKLVNDRFATIRLPQLNTIGKNGKAVGRDYAYRVRQGIEKMDLQAPCGWVIDLRKNGGGNMWPMLAGLDPLLGDPPFGYFALQGGATTPWLRLNKEIWLSSNIQKRSFNTATAPVAVLLSRKTASSGEMVAIALIGRADVRTFGQPTAGFTTANESHHLSDGAILVITVSTVRDRNNADYSGAIQPDQMVSSTATEEAAQRWLRTKCNSTKLSPIW